ncbi:MAG: WecB/TagA/CpsF family glycosyltransferase [Terracidiphilus sp.]|jgi:N-acetylglucosaminyldiphosphoundecaprenol N-acetyl-beta-D-mannosaminyltransferase
MVLIAEEENSFITRPILGVNIAVSSYEDVVRQSLLWAGEERSAALFFAAVHMVMEAHDHPDFLPVLNGAGTVFPDGMPVLWSLRALGERKARRVCGTDTTIAVLAAAEKAGVSVGFYGASQSTLDALVKAVQLRHPSLNIAYVESPPFRPLTAEEDAAVVERIKASGARLLFVGLGCPKQERWIVDHLDRVHAVMFAVGAAFDFIAGNKSRGPKWMSRNGLEWVYRFISEPRRLAVRYLKHNPRFVLLFLRQLLSQSA